MTCTPLAALETRVTPPVVRSFTNTSARVLVSPATRLLARLVNVILVPSAEISGKKPVSPFPCVPSAAVETRAMAPVVRYLTKTSARPLVSPATRLLAVLVKATKLPSRDSEAPVLKPLPSVPSAAVDALTMAPVVRFLTKMSLLPLVSPATRLVAALWKATIRRSAVITASMLLPLLWLPSAAVETRAIAPVPRSLRKRSVKPLVSFGTRFEAVVEKTTARPSSAIETRLMGALACVPSAAVETMDRSPFPRLLTATCCSLVELTRSLALVRNATALPSAAREGPKLLPPSVRPSLLFEARMISPVVRFFK